MGCPAFRSIVLPQRRQGRSATIAALPPATERWQAQTHRIQTSRHCPLCRRFPSPPMYRCCRIFPLLFRRTRAKCCAARPRTAAKNVPRRRRRCYLRQMPLLRLLPRPPALRQAGRRRAARKAASARAGAVREHIRAQTSARESVRALCLPRTGPRPHRPHRQCRPQRPRRLCI